MTIIANTIKQLLTPRDWALEVLSVLGWVESDLGNFLDMHIGNWVEVPEPQDLTREHVFLLLDGAIGFEETAGSCSEDKEDIQQHDYNRSQMLAIQKRFVESAPEECLSIAKNWCVHLVLDESWDSVLGTDFTHSRKVMRGEIQEAVC